VIVKIAYGKTQLAWLVEHKDELAKKAEEENGGKGETKPVEPEKK
jgi:hypothetical protein